MNRRTAAPVFFLLIVGILLNGHVLLRAGLKNDRDQRESQPIEDVTITVDADGLDKAVALPAADLIDVDAATSFRSAFACGRQAPLIFGDLLHQSVRLQV